jgi:hypothetical protein
MVCFLFWVFYISNFIFPILSQQNVSGYFNKLESQVKIDENHKDIAFYIHKYVGSKIYNYCYCLFLFLLTTSFIGNIRALTQKEFLVLNTAPEIVVLQIYGDKLICAPFDRNTKEINKSFLILKLSEDTKQTISYQNVGPLRLKTEW